MTVVTKTNVEKQLPLSGSIRSMNSTKSSVISRKRLLEAHAAREMAELENEQIRREQELHKQSLSAERALITAKLEEKLALLEEEDEVSTQANVDANVRRWVDRSVDVRNADPSMPINDGQWADQDVDVPNKHSHVAVNDMNIVSERKPDTNDIAELARAITNAIKITPNASSINEKLLGRLSAKDLPTFSGDPLDWLRFKNAYTITTRIGQYTEEENLARLQRSLRGEAWDAVSAQLITMTSAGQVMKTLEMRFGRPELILHKVIVDMKHTQKLSGTRSDLVVFATKVANCVAAIETTKHIGYLHSPELVTEVISKLTEPLVYRWLDYVTDLDYSQPRLPALAKYLMAEAERACNAGTIELPQRYIKPTFSSNKRPVFLTNEKEQTITNEITRAKLSNVHAVTVKDKKVIPSICLFCQKESHLLDTCKLFQAEDVNKRWEWVCQEKLCFRCLSGKHRRDRCKAKKRCSVCKRAHHSLLHRSDWPKSNNQDSDADGITENETTANIWAKDKRKVYLKVIPIVVEGPLGTINTFALLDEGSTVTLIERQVADDIGATGPSVDLNLQGVIGDGDKMNSREVSLTIHSQKGTYLLNRVRTVDNLALPMHSIKEDDIKNLSHLSEIPLQAFKGRPKLLIGQDNWSLIVSREIKEGRKNEPVASLTLLGWVIHGFSTTSLRSPEFSLHVRVKVDEDLHDLVKSFFGLESIGIQKVNKISAEDRRALHILDTKTKRINDRWETGLLWRSDDVELPNNRKNAEHRLRLVERKMDADPNVAADYAKQVNNFLDKNYAERATEPITGKRVWYLPHFGVRNLNKPGKLRLVFDAKSETCGVSLNTELLSGPDLLNSLLGVLMRFRERAVAVTGDIREMFLQVKITEEDQKSQCFLWRDMDRVNPPRTYKMTSMTFGATSSPCTATYVLRHNANEYLSSHPRAVMAINKRHYVDDYLDSVDTEEEMKKLIDEVSMIHKAGGFEIRGWATNRPNVLPQTDDNDTSISLLTGTNNVERTLGLHWKPHEDCLGFDFSFKKIDKEVAEGLRKPTKREVLRLIMSIFDPLGLLSPILIKAKILLQNVWRSGIEWDEQLGDKFSDVWFKWLRDLRACKNFSVPRFYGFTAYRGFELHVFVDASEQAYAAVAYIRREADKVVFIAAKCRVAPLKSTTIPRLELQAAVIGSRLGSTIEKELEFLLERRIFWTDSRTVWYWIQKGSRHNQPFVSHRLSNIEELTNPSEWRWVPGNLNPADDATRQDTILKDLASSRWIHGPEFLQFQEELWPTFIPNAEEEEFEGKDEVVLATTEIVKLIDESRFSNWRRLVRSLARVFQFIRKCTHQDKTLTADDEKRAEIYILRQSQNDSFSEEIDLLKKGRIIKPSSNIVRVNPVLDEFSLLRAKGRIEAVKDVPMDMKNPIVLDGRHHVAKLIIEQKHRDLGHHSTETLLNELRQVYYITRLRLIVRSMIAHCIICRARRARCEQPIMADLPPCRLQHHTRPFTFCGIDLFGPMTVTIGRRHEKRWGVIFTCLSIRAVHIELVPSLSTDSTILAIRRMAARRGYPKQIYSDNGTNFRGADKELRKSTQEIFCNDHFSEEMSLRGIEWRFNPPDAPHMGGVWEKLVRSIKVALNAILHSRTPKEELLHTLLLEAENIVNSRPLTHVSLEPNEEEGLTPNHFLLGSSNILPRSGEFSDEDLHLRKQWRIAQRLADKFWSRWIREYLPSLQTRSKWIKDNNYTLGVGDFVLIADTTAPRNVWPRGRVVSCTPGRDGRVRIVDVATQSGVLRRPASKIVLLMSASTMK